MVSIMKIKKTNRRKLWILIAIILLLAAGVIGIIVWKPFATEPSGTVYTDDSSQINYDPPTEDEIRESQDGKKNGGATNDSVVLDSKKGEVQVGISYADINEDGDLEIRAFTNGAIEGDGTCVATMVSGTQKVTGKSKAFIDATSTICQPIYVPRSQLASGTWSVTVKFSSKTHTGTSETVKVSVP
jgi:hypothetical protein